MTEEQKYSELLKELGELLKQKNDEIVYLRFCNRDLESKLAKAEEQLETVVAKNCVEMIAKEKQG